MIGTSCKMTSHVKFSVTAQDVPEGLRMSGHISRKAVASSSQGVCATDCRIPSFVRMYFRCPLYLLLHGFLALRKSRSLRSLSSPVLPETRTAFNENPRMVYTRVRNLFGDNYTKSLSLRVTLMAPKLARDSH